MKLLKYIFLLFFCLASFLIKAQTTNAVNPIDSIKYDTISMDSDELFKIARQKAFNGKKTEAELILKAILNKSPNYDEVRVFLGKVYSWDGLRADARRELGIVLAKNPNNIDAQCALIDVEMWSDNFEQALKLANSGLIMNPVSEDLLLKKINVLIKLNRIKEANNELDKLITINPANEEALKIKKELKISYLKNYITASYTRDEPEKVFDPTNFYSLQYGRKTKYGSGILRYNQTQRASTVGRQAEIDLYPRIKKGMYGYLNYGYSNTLLFPDHRVGAEFYFSLPKSFEASAGARYMYFDSNSDITLYTLTLGKYYGNYWFSGRTFLSDGKKGISNSYTFIIRRYFSNPLDYVGLVGGIGFSPDDRTDQFVNSKSRKVGLDFQYAINSYFNASLTYFFYQQQYWWSDANYINTQSIKASLTVNF